MKDFIRSAHFKIMCLILVLLLIIMFVVSALGVGSSPQSSVLGAVVTPIQRAATAVSDGFRSFFGVWGERDKLKEENAALQSEVNKLRRELIDYDSAKQENILYKDYLGIKEENPDLEFEPAVLISRDAADNYYSFSINKGSINGISKNDPVITADGLVGYVSELSLTYSTVTTILDVDTNVSAIDARTRRDTGIVTGDIKLAAKGLCNMTMMSDKEGISVGDLVVTTGYGGIFPADMLIGTIIEIDESSKDISYVATIEPAADIADVSNVLVITSFNGQGGKVAESETPDGTGDSEEK